MDPLSESRPHHSRRDILKSSGLALLPLAIPSANYALHEQQPMTANGGTDPYPIPPLDKNGRGSYRQDLRMNSTIRLPLRNVPPANCVTF
jgi:hypothetical protein